MSGISRIATIDYPQHITQVELRSLHGLDEEGIQLDAKEMLEQSC
jgi:hypothetical protein